MRSSNIGPSNFETGYALPTLVTIHRTRIPDGSPKVTKTGFEFEISVIVICL